MPELLGAQHLLGGQLHVPGREARQYRSAAWESCLHSSASQSLYARVSARRSSKIGGRETCRYRHRSLPRRRCHAPCRRGVPRDPNHPALNSFTTSLTGLFISLGRRPAASDRSGDAAARCPRRPRTDRPLGSPPVAPCLRRAFGRRSRQIAGIGVDVRIRRDEGVVQFHSLSPGRLVAGC